MKENLIERRETLVKLMFKGLTIQSAAEEMTKNIANHYERQKAIRCIRRDWSNRDSWMDLIVPINSKSFLAELTGSIQEASKYCWVEYSKSKSSMARITALRTIIMSKLRLALVLMHSGNIPQAVQHVDETVTLAGTPFDCDPELKKALILEAERQLEEKLHAQSGADRSRQE